MQNQTSSLEILYSLNERVKEEILPFLKRDPAKVWNPSSVISFDLQKIEGQKLKVLPWKN